MGYYLAKMVGGNSALLVEINNDNFRRLQYMTRIKCARVLNLSMIKCYLLMKEPIPLSAIQANQFINFSYLKKVEKFDSKLFDNLIKFCEASGYLYDLVGREIDKDNKDVFEKIKINYKEITKKNKKKEVFDKEKINKFLENLFKRLELERLEELVKLLGPQIDFIERL